MNSVYDLMEDAIADLEHRITKNRELLSEQEQQDWLNHWRKKDRRIGGLLQSYLKANNRQSISRDLQSDKVKSSSNIWFSILLFIFPLLLFPLWCVHPESILTWSITFAAVCWSIVQVVASYVARWNRVFLYSTGASTIAGVSLSHFKMKIPLPVFGPEAFIESSEPSDVVSVIGYFAGMFIFFLGWKAK